MRRRSVISWLLLLIAVSVTAQEGHEFDAYLVKQDSLLRAAYQRRDPDTFLRLLSGVRRTYNRLSRAGQQNYRRVYNGFYAATLYNLCCTYALLNEKSRALEWLEKAIRYGYLSDSIRMDPDLDNIRDMPQYHQVTDVLFRINDCMTRAEKAKQAAELDSMLHYARKAVLLIASTPNRFPEDEVAASQGMMGYYQWWAGDYPGALESYYRALALAEPFNDPCLSGDMYNGLAMVFRNQGQYRQAIIYFTRTEEATRNTPCSSIYYAAILDKGKAYEQLNILDSAYLYTQQWLVEKQRYTDEFRKLNSWVGGGGGEATLAIIYSKKGQEKLARDFFQLAFYLNIRDDNPRLLARSYCEYAEHFERNNQLDSAVYYASKAFQLDLDNKLLVYQLASSTLLAKLYTERQQIDSAFKYQQVSIHLQDSLFNSDRISRMNALAFNEQLRQIQRETERAAIALERKRNIQYLLIAVGLVTFTILVLLLTRSMVMSAGLIKFLGIVALLLIFEFFNLLLHPFLEQLTHHSPVLMLLCLAAIAAILVPVHHRLEKWATNVLIERNRKIRLMAARKTLKDLPARPEELT
ncbi:tetratricopeptide repeat protein [Flavihumibacter petaseus]|uniref:Tetratricopeptide repeat protein n=1 Tax=Flavihumibacter petaseus NBRC 106054 TaxID=1220578 RepID=A0A0E9MZ89_9BACT|nr:tetratricopeptide repeat protein [Flavihumibacter petaseus]GAO43052.1 hypothetical protein FPE01S_02_01570 [Flavihumibacter petaseus NBRC 106054]